MPISRLVVGLVWLVGLAAPFLRGQPKTARAPLLIRWTREDEPENVHAAYPRPHLVRRDWVNLSGPWDLALT